MPAINDDFTVEIHGKYTKVRFSTLTVNDTIFPNDNITIVIARAVDDEIVFATNNVELVLDYTRDTGDTSASIDDYVNNILTQIRIQDILLLNSSDIVVGDVTGAGSINVFGRNPTITIASAPEDVWAGGGLYTGFNATGSEILDVFSSDEDDDVGGPGALTIRVYGLKTNTSTAYESEDIILTGLVIANSISSWYRVNRAVILTAGSTGNNVGNITIRQTVTTANIFAVMPATFNQTNIAAYTIPFNITGFLVKFSMQISRSSGALGSSLATLRTRDTSNNGVFLSQVAIDIQTGGNYTNNLQYPIPLVALTDIVIRCDDVSDNLTSMSGNFSIFLLSD